MPLHPILLEKLNEALTRREPAATRRDAALPKIRGKIHAVIGMRRAGKTTFLHQLAADLRQHLPPEQVLYVGFDDDRVVGLGAEQLSELLEEHYRRFPELRSRRTVHWFLDEIQLVEGWERFVRRILDTERVEVVVSGSSAKMLSREVHTSLRGRGIETEIRPFDFREFLRHRNAEPDRPSERWTAAERSRIEKEFREYLASGGFPEAQGLSAIVRNQLLQGYVDTVMFRDVIERHGISQVAVLRWLIRHCLRNPAGGLSVHKLHLDLRAQGYAIGKETVHELLGHIRDSFLVETVPIATESVRRQHSNPRKVFPVDHALVEAFDPSGRSNLGHLLEVIVHNELRRRHTDVSYVRTAAGEEVDFLSRAPADDPWLIQVCADPSAPETLARELRALDAAGAEHERARRLLLVADRESVPKRPIQGLIVQSVPEWLLAEPRRR